MIRMEGLPDDIIIEIMRRAGYRDAISFGATSRAHDALRRIATGKRVIKYAHMDYFLYACHRMLSRCIPNTVRSCYFGNDENGEDVPGLSCILHRVPMIADGGSTRARFRLPSRWETTIMRGFTAPMADVSLTVAASAGDGLDDWSFSFGAELMGAEVGETHGPADLQAFLYQPGMYSQRQNACMMLLVSWYAHARIAMGGVRLRSDRRTGRWDWLPAQLPPFHAYIRAAYGPAMGFIRGPQAATQQQ